MAELRKPDMSAVLERTNLARHVGGFLLPIFEAVSNSIHSISEKLDHSKVQTDGKIHIRVKDGKYRQNFSVEIVDNGAGLDSSNYEAFLTPFTGNKLRKNGKGFGRFIAFKVFEDVFYESKISGSEETFRFKFDVYQDEEIIPLKGSGSFMFDEGCSVTYSKVRTEYENRWLELRKREFLDHLTQNFLTYLVDGRMPDTTVEYDGDTTNLRDHFTSVFQYEDSHQFELQLEGESYSFKLDVARVTKGAPFEKHALLFFADNRILGQGRAIEGKLGKSSFERDDGSEYVVIAAVSGPYLDHNANNDRTFLEASEKDIVAIIDKACELILTTEKEQNAAIKSSQVEDVVQVLQSHPLLRFGLAGKTVEQYVARVRTR